MIIEMYENHNKIPVSAHTYLYIGSSMHEIVQVYRYN